VGRAATHTRAWGAVRTQPSPGTTMLWVHKPRTCRPSDPTIVGMTTMLGTTADGDEGVLRVATVRLPPAATAGVNRPLLGIVRSRLDTAMGVVDSMEDLEALELLTAPGREVVGCRVGQTPKRVLNFVSRRPSTSRPKARTRISRSCPLAADFTKRAPTVLTAESFAVTGIWMKAQLPGARGTALDAVARTTEIRVPSST
jgi:hypothetical protein